MSLRSIPPITSIGLRSADPRRFRTRQAATQHEETTQWIVKPEPKKPIRRPLVCGTCGSRKILGVQFQDSTILVDCPACDGLQPGQEIANRR